MRHAHARALAALALLAGACGRADEVPAPADPAALLRADPRIAWLLGNCARNDHYDRDTSDMVPLLAGKLAVADPDPLRRAKEALVEYGARAVPELARLVNRYFPEPLSFAYVQNALEVLAGIEDPSARETVLRCLGHPSESIRLLALRGLRNHHARPEDWDMLRARMEVEAGDVRQSIGLALHRADPGRAELEYVQWIAEGSHEDLWRFVLPLLPRSPHPETAVRCAAVYASARSGARAWLAATVAKSALPEAAPALELLRAELALDDVGLRTSAVEALRAAGLARELSKVLLDDPDPELRTLAAAGLAALPPDAEVTTWLSRGLDDPTGAVRATCLTALVLRGDPAAEDRLLYLLDGEAQAFQHAIDVLKGLSGARTSFHERVLERLVRRAALESHLPVERRAPLYQGIGLLPLAGAARYLREQGLALEQPIQGMPAHRWMTTMASNSGLPGRTFLAQELARETDALRRIDILWALSAVRDDLARSTLRERIEAADTAPYELLFAAERLANLGPASDVAPLLKRSTLRVRQEDVRLALQCLLWRWY